MSGKKAHSAATDPVEVGKRPKPSRERMRALARIGGLALAASLTDEEMSARMRGVRAARTEKDDARLAERGLPPRTARPKPLSDDEMQQWLLVVEERYPGRVYENRMQKRRLAERLAREAAARMAAEAFQNRGTA